MKRTTLLLLILLIFEPCFAGEHSEPDQKKEQEICKAVERGEVGGANIEGECANKKLVQLNKKMNKIYNKALTKLPETAEIEAGQGWKDNLIASQNAWIKYKESDCSLQTELTGANSTWKSTNYINCEVVMTQKRIEQLNEMFP